MTRRPPPSRRLHIDWTRCDGRGLCTELLPTVLDRDDWGYPVARNGDREPGIRRPLQADAQAAVRLCPRLALTLRPNPLTHYNSLGPQQARSGRRVRNNARQRAADNRGDSVVRAVVVLIRGDDKQTVAACGPRATAGAVPIANDRLFDSLSKLGIDKVPSDIDIQISSDEIVSRARSIYQQLDVPDNQINVNHVKYAFVKKELLEETCPYLTAWANRQSDILSRPVTIAAFPAWGPPRINTFFSNHFRQDDWMIHLGGGGE